MMTAAHSDAYVEVNRKLRGMETATAASFHVDVRLLSGADVVSGLPFTEVDTVMGLKGVLRERYGEWSPFRLLLHGQALRNRSTLEGLPHGAELTLVRMSVPDISEMLVGPRGAVAAGDLATIHDLLDDGADVNWRDQFRLRTPLMWAAAEGQADAARLLLARGADGRLRANGARADVIARANGHQGLASLLSSAQVLSAPAVQT